MPSTKKPWAKGHPGIESIPILNAAFEYVNSVPYKVSLRWVFYRLLQDGFYNDKEGYNRFKFICAKARYSRWGGWRPDTLADETRHVIERPSAVVGEDEAVDEIRQNLRDSAFVWLDHFCRQDNYVELWFEARAMANQFKYYTTEIDLAPMAGNASIPFKWNLAKRLEAAAEKYGKDIIILYFGDEDQAGHGIKKDVVESVEIWCEVPFNVVWCGLTEAQIEKYRLPENVEKKGFQWEALEDEDAGEIITSSLGEYINLDLMAECDRDAKKIQKDWSEKIDEWLEGF